MRDRERSTCILNCFATAVSQVTLWPDNLNEDREYIGRLQGLGIEVIHSSAYHHRFAEWLNDNRAWINYAFVSRPHIARHYLGALEAVGTKVIYYGHDLHYRRTLKEFEITGETMLLKRAEADKALEKSVWSKCNVILYPSVEECDEVRGLVSGDKAVVPFPITFFSDAALKQTAAKLDRGDSGDPYSLMFIGGFSHTPNVDAMIWFVTEVMPLLRKRSARFVLRIAGSNAPSTITALVASDVHILGRISDDHLAGLYASSGLAVLPLRYGGGVKGKLIEAFAAGTPVVSTSVGVQGVDNADMAAFVADDPASFAEQIMHAAVNRSDAVAKARHALEFIQRHYSENNAVDVLAPHMPELRKR